MRIASQILETHLRQVLADLGLAVRIRIRESLAPGTPPVRQLTCVEKVSVSR